MKTRNYILLPALAALILVATPLQAQDLNVYMSVDTDIVATGDRVAFTVTTTNTGPTQLLSVSVEIQLPADIANFTCPPGWSGLSTCRANQVRTWNVGTLAPGESRRTIYRPAIAGSASPGAISSTATASASGMGDVQASREVQIVVAPPLRLSLAPDSGPGVAGATFSYTLSYTNDGAVSPTSAVLTMPVPAGTSFASASGGGSESGGVVTWDLGTVGTGTAGQVRLEVDVDAGLSDGAVIKAEAALDSGIGGAPTVRSSAVTPVRGGVPLKIGYAVSQTSNRLGYPLTYTITTTNEGPLNLLDVSVEVLLPAFISDFPCPPEWSGLSTCRANQRRTWSIGTLAPGENRTIVFRAGIASDAPQSDILRSIVTAFASNAGDATAALDAYVNPIPDLELDLAADVGPAVAGTSFTYTLTVGNVGSSSLSSLSLRMPVPEGTTFFRATDGGAHSDDVVTWQLGSLGPGVSRQVRLTVDLANNLPDGRLLRARAELDPDIGTVAVARASTVTPVRGGVPLNVAYTVSQTEAGDGVLSIFSFTVSNSGPVNLLNVGVQVLLPGRINSTSCPADWSGLSTCRADQRRTWNIGTLSPGESRTSIMRAWLDEATPPGEILRSWMRASSSNGGEATAPLAMAADPVPLMRLSLAPDPRPAMPGQPYSYTLTFGNAGSSAPSDVVINMAVPEGTSFESASGGGAESDGIVAWSAGTIGPGQGGRFQLTVRPDAEAPDGSLLFARTQIDPAHANALIVRSLATTPIRGDVPLRVSYDLNRIAAHPDESLTYTITAINEGAVNLLSAAATVWLPHYVSSFPCPSDWSGHSTCRAGQRRIWNIGTLAPGEQRTTSFTTSLVNDAPVGEVVRSHVRATASGSNEVVLQRDVLVGSILNFPPSAAVITSPEDGATFLVGGPDEDNPVLPDSSFVVEWTASTDPEGDPLTYTWQLSASQAFTNLLVNELSAEDGTALRYETDFGTLEELLVDQGVEVGQSITLYHRVVTRDGTNQTFSESASIVLTRGTIVSTKDEPALPATFALHANYPNPFNPSTTFAFDLSEPAEVRLVVYDALGRKVATVVSRSLLAGRHEYTWDAGHLPSGVYVYRLEAGEYREMRRMVLVK